MIGALNTHDDPIVAQYSFWAAAKHPRLGITQMRVTPKDYSKLPANVQGWAFRVLTKDPAESLKHYDLITSASSSDEREVREGLATGLRDSQEAVEALKAAPTQSNAQRLLGWMKGLAAGGRALDGLVTTGNALVTDLDHLLPNLPTHF